MASVVRSILKSSRSLVASVTSSFPVRTCLPTMSAVHRNYATDPYDPYPIFDTPSPFKKREKYRHGYMTKQHTGGVVTIFIGICFYVL